MKAKLRRRVLSRNNGTYYECVDKEVFKIESIARCAGVSKPQRRITLFGVCFAEAICGLVLNRSAIVSATN